MKLCYHDAWLYTKVKRLKYKAAFYSPKGKQEKNLIVEIWDQVGPFPAHTKRSKILFIFLETRA